MVGGGETPLYKKELIKNNNREFTMIVTPCH